MNSKTLDWNSMCRSLESFALNAARRHPGRAAELIAAVEQRFCDLDRPESSSELTDRYSQKQDAQSLIGNIELGDDLAKSSPPDLDAIFELLTNLCDREFPSSGEKRHNLYSDLEKFREEFRSINLTH